jgi:hypothetical protein
MGFDQSLSRRKGQGSFADQLAMKHKNLALHRGTNRRPSDAYSVSDEVHKLIKGGAHC